MLQLFFTVNIQLICFCLSKPLQNYIPNSCCLERHDVTYSWKYSIQFPYFNPNTDIILWKCMAEKNVCGGEGSWTLLCLLLCPDLSELSLMCAGKTQHGPGRENHESIWSCGWINNITVLQKGFMQSQNNLVWKGTLEPLCQNQCKLQTYIKLLRSLFSCFFDVSMVGDGTVCLRIYSDVWSPLLWRVFYWAFNWIFFLATNLV